MSSTTLYFSVKYVKIPFLPPILLKWALNPDSWKSSFLFCCGGICVSWMHITFDIVNLLLGQYRSRAVRLETRYCHCCWGIFSQNVLNLHCFSLNIANWAILSIWENNTQQQYAMCDLLLCTMWSPTVHYVIYYCALCDLLLCTMWSTIVHHVI